MAFKGYGLKPEDVASCRVHFRRSDDTLKQGSVVIAAITCCTNTSNPSVMLGAGLLAKNAVERGLPRRNFIKTSLAPGSGVVTKYLEMSGLQPYLDKLDSRSSVMDAPPGQLCGAQAYGVQPGDWHDIVTVSDHSLTCCSLLSSLSLPVVHRQQW